MKIYFESYGCTLSKSEAGLYVNKLIKDGGEIVSNPSEADLSVIGTCVVIKQTEERMIDRIADLSIHSKVKVMGCLPSVSGGVLSSDSIEVVDPSEFRSFYTGTLDDIEIKEPSIFDGIPINQGCTGSCNYCISRVARGKLLSRSPDKIVNQIKMQLDRGIKEVRISSLDTAAYGKDIGTSLDNLIERITGIPYDFRLRVGMMEPKNTYEIKENIFSAYKNEKVFKFLHVPVQSGDDRILDLMNREYEASQFIKIAEDFRNLFSDSTLSTDIISGYHDEDEVSFENTYKMLEKVRPEIMNITRFSPRPFTPDYDKKLPTSNLVKRWTKEFTDLHRAILSERLSKRVNKVEKILITEKGKNGTVVGRDEAYRPVVLNNDLPLYTYAKCEIVDFSSTYLIGRIITN